MKIKQILLVPLFIALASSCATITENYDEFTGEKTVRTTRNWIFENIFTNERLSMDLIQKVSDKKRVLSIQVGYGSGSLGTYLNIKKGNSLIFIVDGKRIPFKLEIGRHHTLESSQMAVGKFERADYIIKDIKNLKQIIFSKSAKYKLYGEFRSIEGELEEEDFDLFQEFYKSHLE